MDGGLATLRPQLSTTQEIIPTEIYQPLLAIALHGYDANDVNVWYRMVQRHLGQMGGDSTQGAYGAFTMTADPTIEAHYSNLLDSECAARRATMATIDSCISPMNPVAALPSTEHSAMEGEIFQPRPMHGAVMQDNSSQAYNTPQSYQTYTTTPQQLDPTPEPPQSQPLLPTWSPAPSSAAEPDPYGLCASASMSTGNLMAFEGNQAYPWFGAHDLSSYNNRTQSQHSQLSISQHSQTSSQQMAQLQHHHSQQPYLAPEYNSQLSGASMPVLVPYASAAGSNYTKAAAIPTGPGASLYSSSSGYFPIIHVSSSRRRRKALQKGVKKIVQPLKGRRQQSV